MLNFDKTIDTLCFSGGGTKGLVFIGGVKALIDKNIISLQNIKKFIGTSAGSIIAFLLSINYTPEEIEDFVLNFNFKKLEADPSCENLFSNFGLDDGKKLEYLLSKLLYFKINQFEKSIENLFMLIDFYPDGKISTMDTSNEVGSIVEKAKYLLVQCYLALDNVKKAEEIFDKMLNDGETYLVNNGEKKDCACVPQQVKNLRGTFLN